MKTFVKNRKLKLLSLSLGLTLLTITPHYREGSLEEILSQNKRNTIDQSNELIFSDLEYNKKFLDFETRNKSLKHQLYSSFINLFFQKNIVESAKIYSIPIEYSLAINRIESGLWRESPTGRKGIKQVYLGSALDAIRYAHIKDFKGSQIKNLYPLILESFKKDLDELRERNIETTKLTNDELRNYQRVYGRHLPKNSKTVKFVEEVINKSSLNIEIGDAYLRYLYDMFGDWSIAIASYHDGPGKIAKLIHHHKELTQDIKAKNDRSIWSETKGADFAYLREYVKTTELTYLDLLNNKDLMQHYYDTKNPFNKFDKYTLRVMKDASK